jgi:hypothetical protein
MEKKIAGLLGAAATLGTLNAAQASPAPTQDDILRANSFAELLEPISNAASLLQAIDESTPPPSANVQLASSPQLLPPRLLRSRGIEWRKQDLRVLFCATNPRP